MSAVCVKEPAAICAQHLNRFLRSYRGLGNALGRYRLSRRLAIQASHGCAKRLHKFRLVIQAKVLHHPLRDEQQRIDDAGWK